MTELRAGLPIIGFVDATVFEAWIEAQPDGASGLWLKLAKKDSGIKSLSKAEAIDAALCHGWIDGQLDKYDDRCWLIRFTPRKPRSKWSEVNRIRALELIEAGRMQSAGLAQIEAAKIDADGRRHMPLPAAPKCQLICRWRLTGIPKRRLSLRR